MRDNSVLKVYETKAEWEHIKEEEIQKQDHELKNEITFKNLTETVNEVQSKFDVLEQTITALSNRVSNDDDQFSELNEILRKLDETLNKDDTILSQHNEILTRQNETTQVLNTDENNLEEQTILLLGGWDGKDNNTLLLLENDERNWKELNVKLPHAVWDHGAQFLNNNLYIFGGKDYYETLNCTYNLSKSVQWEKMADMNQKRSGISNSSVILNNQIWVCGGTNGEEQDLESVEMYDPETNKWKYMKSMNDDRSNAAAVVVNGKIFCSGGFGVRSVECYDPSSDIWTFICNMPQMIWGHGAVEIDGHFTLIAGDSNRGCSKNVWALDTTNENAIWIEKPSMLMSNLYFSIAKIHHKIVVCGGASKENVEIFDGKVWRSGPKMPTIRAEAPAVAISMQFARSLS